MMRRDQIRFSAAFVFFNVAFFLLLTLAGLLHLHGWRGLLLAIVGAGLFVALSRRWQRALSEPFAPPKNARYSTPTGSRAQRRATARERRKGRAP